MAQQTSSAATMGEFQSRGDDFLHLKNSSGAVVGGIDNTGTGFGTLQGGFIPPATKTLYVDGNRTDSYTADGSLLKPFKTIMGAVNQVINNGDNSTSVLYRIDIATGIYPELIVLENVALVSLVFHGHGSVTVSGAVGCLRSTANNSNLVQVDFREISIGGLGGSNDTVSLSGSGNFLSNGLNFYEAATLLNTWTQTGGNTQFFDTSTQAVTTTLTGVGTYSLFGRTGIATGGTVSLNSSSTLAILRGASSSATINIDATSTYNLGAGSRQAGPTVTVNGSFTNRFSNCSANIVVNNGGTYQEIGGNHSGTLTINAGGNYTQTGSIGTGGLVLGAAAPTVPAGEVGLGNGTATSATAGAQSLPANPAGFLIVNIGGTVQKIPYYNT